MNEITPELRAAIEQIPACADVPQGLAAENPEVCLLQRITVALLNRAIVDGCAEIPMPELEESSLNESSLQFVNRLLRAKGWYVGRKRDLLGQPCLYIEPMRGSRWRVTLGEDYLSVVAIEEVEAGDRSEYHEKGPFGFDFYVVAPDRQLAASRAYRLFKQQQRAAIAAAARTPEYQPVVEG